MTIILSQNEIRAEAEKALRGVGVDWGMAKDGGVMAALMAAHDLPFLGALNHCLDNLALDNLAGDNLDHHKPAHSTAPNKAAPIQLAPIQLIDFQADQCIAPFQAMARAEYIAATQKDWSGQVFMPRFLIPGLAIVAQEQACAFTLLIDGTVKAVADHRQIWLGVDAIPNGWHDVQILSSAGDLSGLEPCLHSEQIAHQAPLNCWQKLGQYSSRTYVPETEEKRRAGAGAGDIDNQ